MNVDFIICFIKRKQKASPSDVKFALIVAAITSVLAMGTGFSSTQSFGLDFNGLGAFDALDKLTQGADCFGLGK